MFKKIMIGLAAGVGTAAVAWAGLFTYIVYQLSHLHSADGREVYSDVEH